LLLFSLLAALWPAAVLHSVRLGNDAPFYFLGFLLIYLLQNEKWKSAAATAAISMLIKSNGVVLIAIFFAYSLWKRIPRRLGALCFLIIAMGLGAAKGSQVLKLYDPHRMDALGPKLAVHNTVTNMLLADPISFVSDTFVNPWIPTFNRNYLWNYFWKTSLFGEWTYDFPSAPLLAQVVSAILVALLLALVAVSLRFRTKALALPAFCLFFSFAAIFAYRFLHSFACNADFRFVYPFVALPIAILFAVGERRTVADAVNALEKTFAVGVRDDYGAVWA
jgi:Gpi18-like mannosyltransferase